MSVASGSSTELRIHTSSTNTEFVGELMIDGAGDCEVSGDSAAGTNLDLSVGVCVSLAPAALLIGAGASVANTFVQRPSFDAVNASAGLSGGSVLYSAANIDWFGFENNMRVWGRHSALFPDALAKGACASGDTCGIWDFSVQSTDNQIKNVLPVPSGADASIHFWAANDATNCTTLDGNWDGANCTTTYLVRAVEISRDGIGNDNTLCESNEACLYTPNIGRYQGHGLLQALSFADGQISGVSLQQYSTNGR